MKAHIFMPDRTHSVAATLLTVFYANPCVLQHFIATGVPSFIPDDTIIATVNHCFMPEITHNATVAYMLISGRTNSYKRFLTDSPLIYA